MTALVTGECISLGKYSILRYRKKKETSAARDISGEKAQNAAVREPGVWFFSVV